MNRFYKTKWCEFWWRSHSCRHGASCTHAHDIWDWRGSREDIWLQWMLAEERVRHQYRERWQGDDAGFQDDDDDGDARGQDAGDWGHGRWQADGDDALGLQEPRWQPARWQPACGRCDFWGTVPLEPVCLGCGALLPPDASLNALRIGFPHTLQVGMANEEEEEEAISVI